MKHVVAVCILLFSGLALAQAPVVEVATLMGTIKSIVLAVLSVNVILSYVSGLIAKIPVVGPLLQKYLFDVIMANPAHKPV